MSVREPHGTTSKPPTDNRTVVEEGLPQISKFAKLYLYNESARLRLAQVLTTDGKNHGAQDFTNALHWVVTLTNAFFGTARTHPALENLLTTDYVIERALALHQLADLARQAASMSGTEAPLVNEKLIPSTVINAAINAYNGHA